MLTGRVLEVVGFDDFCFHMRITRYFPVCPKLNPNMFIHYTRIASFKALYFCPSGKSQAKLLQKTCPCSCPCNNAGVPWPLRRGVLCLGANWLLHPDISRVDTRNSQTELGQTQHSTYTCVQAVIVGKRSHVAACCCISTGGIEKLLISINLIEL